MARGNIVKIRSQDCCYFNRRFLPSSDEMKLAIKNNLGMSLDFPKSFIKLMHDKLLNWKIRRIKCTRFR